MTRFPSAAANVLGGAAVLQGEMEHHNLVVRMCLPVIPLVVSACGPLVKDGSFEKPAAGARYVTLAAGSHVGPWEVRGGRVDLVAARAPAAGGVQSVHLGANASVAQSVGTRAGERYRVRFAMAGSADAGPRVKRMAFYWDGKLIEMLEADTGNYRPGELAWKEYSYEVTATAARTEVRFANPTDVAWGPYVDRISVERVK